MHASNIINIVSLTDYQKCGFPFLLSVQQTFSLPELINRINVGT